MLRLFYLTGLLLRLPAFLLAVAVVTILWLPVVGLAFLCRLLFAPFAFLKAAFKNNPSEFREFWTTVSVRHQTGRAYRLAWEWWKRGTQYFEKFRL